MRCCWGRGGERLTVSLIAQIVLVLIPLISLRDRAQRRIVAIIMKTPEQSRSPIKSFLDLIRTDDRVRKTC